MTRSHPVALRGAAPSFIASAALCAVALAFASPAGATPIGAPLLAGNTTDIIWTGDSGGAVVSGLGTSDVTLDGVTTTTLTLSVVQTMAAGDSMGGVFGALAWDTDLGNELGGPGPLVVLTPPAGFFSQSTVGYDDPVFMPPTRDSTGALSGYALGLDQINNSKPGPSGVTFTVFTVDFTVNNGTLTTDGNDIFWGAFGTGNALGTDGGALAYNASNSPWAGASVNIIPEPTTLSLIALGCSALAVAGRRRKTND